MQVFVCDRCKKVIEKPSEMYAVSLTPYQSINSLNSSKRRKVQIFAACCKELFINDKEEN